MEDQRIDRLGDWMAEGRRRYAAAPPKPMDYPLSIALNRARNGSTRDARVILAMLAIMLRQRVPDPFSNVVALHCDLAEYLADALDEILLRAAKPDVALGLTKRKRGPGPFDQDDRNQFVHWMVDRHIEWGESNPFAAVADILAEADYPPPSRGRKPQAGRCWTEEAVRDAVSSHLRAVELSIQRRQE